MLELKHVSKTFNPGTEDAKKALDDLSLSVADGDFITIIGANGAGKSTLFGAVCGTFLTDTGTITLDGENITMQPQHQRARVIGHLFQDPMRGSAPGMSIEENLALAAGHGGWLSRVSRADQARFHQKMNLPCSVVHLIYSPLVLFFSGEIPPGSGWFRTDGINILKQRTVEPRTP